MKIVMAISGGMDSTTLLAKLLSQGNTISPFWFFYGSKHNKYEQQAVRAVMRYYQAIYTSLNDLKEIDLSAFMSDFKSALMKNESEDVPEGEYNEPSMTKTVVPARNLIFISILSGIAASIDADAIALGVHAGDHYIYPDCRPAFLTSVQRTVEAALDRSMRLLVPYMDMTKADIAQQGIVLRVPYELTRTCYKDQPVPCGKCGACNERLAAFKEVGGTDPVRYAQE